MVLDVRKPDFVVHANNMGRDQPWHPYSLISAFVILFLEGTVVKAALCKNSMFYSALDKLLGQLGTYATWLSSIAYL